MCVCNICRVCFKVQVCVCMYVCVFMEGSMNVYVGMSVSVYICDLCVRVGEGEWVYVYR